MSIEFKTTKLPSIVSSVNKIYDTSGFTGKYGHHLYITVISTILIMLGFAYYSIMSKIKPIRNNWIKERCKPNIIPFAGFIYKPEGKTVLEATADNFAECGQNVTKNIAGYALQPFRYLLTAVTSSLKEISNSIIATRSIFSKMRDGIAEFTDDVMGRSLNIMTPLQTVMVDVKDIMAKSNGVGSSVIYVLYGAYLTLKALLGSIIDFIKIGLIALAALIIILWAIPFVGWFAAGVATACYIVIAVILAIVIINFNNIIKS